MPHHATDGLCPSLFRRFSANKKKKGKQCMQSIASMHTGKQFIE